MPVGDNFSCRSIGGYDPGIHTLKEVRMPRRWITRQQVEIYKMARKQDTQKVSAAKAGISERSGRNIAPLHNDQL